MYAIVSRDTHACNGLKLGTTGSFEFDPQRLLPGCPIGLNDMR